MKHIAVVNPMKCSDNSIIASSRIAKFLAQQLKCPLIDTQQTCYSDDEKLDVLYVVNGPMLYCNFRESLKAMVANAEQVVWIENDYAISAPGFIKQKDPILLSACENFRKANRYAYVNWNQLTFNESFTSREIKHRGLCYYGALRKGRIEYFKKYLGGHALYPVHISGPIEKFKSTIQNPEANYFKADPNLRCIGDYEATIYIEDLKSHQIYTSPANRFYECLSTHTLQLFDMSVIGTFIKAGIGLDADWFVDNEQDVVKKLIKSESLRNDQLKKLRSVNYHSKLVGELQAALKTVIS
jgi:hypothetical protein